MGGIFTTCSSFTCVLKVSSMSALSVLHLSASCSASAASCIRLFTLSISTSTCWKEFSVRLSHNAFVKGKNISKGVGGQTSAWLLLKCPCACLRLPLFPLFRGCHGKSSASILYLLPSQEQTWVSLFDILHLLVDFCPNTICLQH